MTKRKAPKASAGQSGRDQKAKRRKSGATGTVCTNGLWATKWTEALQRRVQDADSKKPRFLFCSYTMGGCPSQSHFTATALVPGKFYDSSVVPQSMFDMPLDKIQKHWKGRNLKNDKAELWTQWSSGLQIEIEGGLDYTTNFGYEAEETLVAILDTSMLPSCHHTLPEFEHCCLMHDPMVQSEDIWSTDFFWIYGCIPATAYKAVSMATLLSEFTPDVAWKKSLRLIDVITERLPSGAQDLEVDLAKELAKAFGNDRSLFVACMAVTVLPHEPADIHEKWMHDDYGPKMATAQAFDCFAVPADWYQDPKIMYDCDPLPLPSVCRGISLLRLIMKNKQKPSSLELPWFHDIHNQEDNSMSMHDLASEVDRIGFRQFLEGSVRSDDSTSTFHPNTATAAATIADTLMTEITENEPPGLPLGVMPDGTKQVLLNAQKRTPRYLFRGWRHGPTPSGGYRDLNSTESIIPLAYLGKPRKASTGIIHKTISYFIGKQRPEDIFHLTHEQLQDMTRAHLQGTHHPKTEFSSWAASLRVAFRYATKTGYISIIDTNELEDQNVIIHVPSLRPIIGGAACYPEEYLAHGVISGKALKAVPMSVFLNAGCTTDHFTTLGGLGYTSSRTFAITDQDLANAKQVAVQYGPSFAAPVMIAVLTLKQRDAKFWREGLNGAHLRVNAAMKEFVIPKKLCADATVLTDIVHCNGFGEVEQMLRLLRAVVELRHGKGARTLEKEIGWVGGKKS